MSDWPTSVEELSRIENASIRAFVESCAEHFTGRVLDYGCGRQPYRDVVEKAGGEYVPWDRKGLPGGSVENVGPVEAERHGYTAILCTQVIQYVPEVEGTLANMRDAIRPGGALVLTGPTSWIEPPGHLHNLTQAGIRRLLEQAGFAVERLECRGKIGPGLSIGYGVLARA